MLANTLDAEYSLTMSLNGRYFHDRLQSAAQRELLDSDSMLMADLQEAITPRRSLEGLRIDLGDDKETLEHILDEIGLTQAMQNYPEIAHIHNVVLAHGSTQSFLGKAIPALEQLRLTDALDALQSDAWITFKESGIYTRIGARKELVTSSILIANSAYNEDGQKIADLEKPGLVVGVSYRYLPEFVDDAGYIADISLPRFIDTARSKPHNGDSVTWKLAQHLSYSDTELAMPQRRYYMKIGMIAPIMFSYADVHTKPSNRFSLDAGRLSQVRLEPFKRM